jgi:hypothetical protein
VRVHLPCVSALRVGHFLSKLTPVSPKLIGMTQDTERPATGKTVHPKPEWSDEQRKHAELSKRLKAHCKGNSYFPNEALFPSRWISHEATKWAVETAMAFIAAFEADATMKPKWVWTDSRLKP